MKKAILLNDTSDENHLGSMQTVQSIKGLLHKHGFTVVKPFSRKAILESESSVKEAVKDANLIVVNGEGTMHRGNKIMENIARLCARRSSVLINTVWEKMFVDTTDFVNLFSLIAVRESYSYREIVKFVDKKKVMLVPDAIFYTKVEKPTTVIGYGDSVLDYLRTNLSRRKNYFPTELVATKPDWDAYITWLRSLDLHVTGRFHGVCAAALAGTPFVAFPSNSYKVEGLLADMGCQDLLIDRQSTALGKKQRAVELQPKIQEYVVRARTQLDVLFGKLKHFAEKQ